MIGETCPREDELLASIERRFIGAELESHVSACSSCRELRVVAGALLDERVDAMAEAAVPSAGAMWWRMQLRQRQEAMAAARRSLLIGQAVTLATAAILVVALLGGAFTDGLSDVIGSALLTTPLLLSLAAWIVLAPLAGYMATRERPDRRARSRR